MKLVKDADELWEETNENHHFIRIIFREVFLKSIYI